MGSSKPQEHGMNACDTFLSLITSKLVLYLGLLKKFGMKNAKPIKTPLRTNGHLDLDTGGKSVDQKVYRSMIGSLLYLCTSRPDIMLSVCTCARFQANHEIFSLHS
jgi:hypothetical protein